MAKKNDGTTLIIIVVVVVAALFFVVAIIGILAAIAIPSFVGYIKKSKAIEGEMEARSIAYAIEEYHLTNCAFPPNLAPTSDLPSGGNKLIAAYSGSGWDEINYFNDGMPKYFRYDSVTDGNVYTIRAQSDFVMGGPVHTVSLDVTRSDASCTVTIGNPVIDNEGQ